MGEQIGLWNYLFRGKCSNSVSYIEMPYIGSIYIKYGANKGMLGPIYNSVIVGKLHRICYIICMILSNILYGYMIHCGANKWNFSMIRMGAA